MIVGIVSDTHDNLKAIRKIKKALEESGVRYIVHLGDFVSPFSFKEIYSGFEKRGFGVLGNNDGEQYLISRLAEKMEVKIFNYPTSISLGDKRILMLHGFGDAANTLEIARGLALSGKYDIVLFGHTHQFYYERIGNVVLLNPGEGGGWLTGLITAVELNIQTKELRKIEEKRD